MGGPCDTHSGGDGGSGGGSPATGSASRAPPVRLSTTPAAAVDDARSADRTSRPAAPPCLPIVAADFSAAGGGGGEAGGPAPPTPPPPPHSVLERVGRRPPPDPTTSLTVVWQGDCSPPRVVASSADARISTASGGPPPPPCVRDARHPARGEMLPFNAPKSRWPAGTCAKRHGVGEGGEVFVSNKKGWEAGGWTLRGERRPPAAGIPAWHPAPPSPQPPRPQPPLPSRPPQALPPVLGCLRRGADHPCSWAPPARRSDEPHGAAGGTAAIAVCQIGGAGGRPHLHVGGLVLVGHTTRMQTGLWSPSLVWRPQLPRTWTERMRSVVVGD